MSGSKHYEAGELHGAQLAAASYTGESAKGDPEVERRRHFQKNYRKKSAKPPEKLG